MRGLILQKVLSLKKVMQIYVVFIIFYGIIGVTTENISFISALLVLFTSFLPISVFAIEDRSKWDLYANVMPVTRKQIVRSQYLFFGVILLIAIFFDVIFSIAEIATGQSNVKDSIQLSYGFMALSILVQLVMIPIFIKFGSAIAQVAIVVICMVPTLIIMMISKLGVPIPSIDCLKAMIPYTPILLVVLVIISYNLSLYFYDKKDL